MWYDEANRTYVLLEDSVIDTQNQTVSVVTTHFSTYLLVDSEIWIDAWRNEINYDEVNPEDIQSTYDIFVCMDYTMSPEEFALGKEFVQKIIDQMVEGDRISLGIAFINNTYSYSGLESKSSATITLERLERAILGEHYEEPSGNHRMDMPFMVSALSKIRMQDTTNKKMGIIVNSGKNEPIFTMYTDEDVKRFLKEMNYPVYSVSVTYEEDEEFVDILEEYGGKGFIATTSDRLISDYHLGCDTLDMLDTDGDGLADTYEINGVRVQNGTVAYTDPYSVDTDGDGITDYAELGGTPNKLLMNYTKLHEFSTTINYQISDPNDPNSTGREISAGYMIIDDFDYLPYDKDNYERIFFDDTYELDEDGNKIYGRYNIYASNPDELSRFQAMSIISSVISQEIVFQMHYSSLVEDARSNLYQYVCGKEERYIYDCKQELKDSAEAREMWAQAAYHLMLAAEGCLEKDQTIILAETPNNEARGIEFKPNFSNLFVSTDDWLAIHSAKARALAEVSFDGEKYTMKMRFYIFDYYDWDKDSYEKIGVVSAKDLYKLCRSGGARFYENWGVFDTIISWEPNDMSRDNVLTEQKQKMME